MSRLRTGCWDYGCRVSQASTRERPIIYHVKECPLYEGLIYDPVADAFVAVKGTEVNDEAPVDYTTLTLGELGERLYLQESRLEWYDRQIAEMQGEADRYREQRAEVEAVGEAAKRELVRRYNPIAGMVASLGKAFSTKSMDEGYATGGVVPGPSTIQFGLGDEVRGGTVICGEGDVEFGAAADVPIEGEVDFAEVRSLSLVSSDAPAITFSKDNDGAVIVMVACQPGASVVRTVLGELLDVYGETVVRDGLDIVTAF